MSISPELQKKIDALSDEGLKARIIRVLSGPGMKDVTDEEIFQNLVSRSERAKIDRATRRQWHDDEVIDFIDFFRDEMPDDYANFIRQERDLSEIDSDLSWRLELLARKWFPEIVTVDYALLLRKVRGYVRNNLI